MGKITKRVVDAAEGRANDYVIWDDELPGFGPRVFVSGKRSYVIQYRAAGRSRRYTIANGIRHLVLDFASMGAWVNSNTRWSQASISGAVGFTMRGVSSGIFFVKAPDRDRMFRSSFALKSTSRLRLLCAG